MALTKQSDDAGVTAGFARWLTQRGDVKDLTVSGPERPSAGYSSETIMVDASWSASGPRHSASLVIRMAPAESGTFRHYDLVAQCQAQAAAAAGVPVADPVVDTDTRWLGAPFMVMTTDRGSHHRRPVPPRSLASERHGRGRAGPSIRNFVSTMSLIHPADTGAARRVPRRDHEAELAFWDDYLAWSSGGPPVPVLVGRPGVVPPPPAGSRTTTRPALGRRSLRERCLRRRSSSPWPSSTGT